jgi:hypothetical protein
LSVDDWVWEWDADDECRSAVFYRFVVVGDSHDDDVDFEDE